MEFFDELNRSISGVSKVGSLKTLIRDEEKRINALFVEIGTRYFESNKNDPNALYGPQIAEIKAAQERIDGYNQQIYMTRGGAPARPVCTKCGNAMLPADKFCAVCGTPAGTQQSAGKLCVKCGALIMQDSVFCNSCGAQQVESQPEVTVTCAACGATLKADMAFCMICGAKMGATEETPAPYSESAVEEVVESKPVEETEPETETELIKPEVVESEPESVAEPTVVEAAAQEVCDSVESVPVSEAPITEEVVQEVICEKTVDVIEDVNPYENILFGNVCRACGKEVSPTAKFCIFCGTKR